MRHLLSVKMLAIGLVFVLAACANSPIPEINQDIPQKVVQQEESEPDQELPDETEQMDQAPIVEPEIESNVGEEPPAQEDQSPDSGYPSPPKSAGGDPLPEGGYPAPALETGYPAPAENLPTPTLMPAYPAPAEDQGGTTDPPPIKTGLEATDPATVKLASGELQFIEFFAFW